MRVRLKNGETALYPDAFALRLINLGAAVAVEDDALSGEALSVAAATPPPDGEARGEEATAVPEEEKPAEEEADAGAAGTDAPEKKARKGKRKAPCP